MKIKAKIKSDQLVIKVKLGLNESISEEQLGMFQSCIVRGFLRPEQIKKKVLQYTGPAGEPLDQYLTLPITEHDFYSLMAQITEAVKKIRNQELPADNLLLDVREIYINRNTREMQFIYFPFATSVGSRDESGKKMVNLMELIAFLVRKTYGRDMDFLTRYVQFLRGMGTADIQKIENYLVAVDAEIGLQLRRQARQNTWKMTEHSGMIGGYSGTTVPNSMAGGYSAGTVPLFYQNQEEDTNLLTENRAFGTEDDETSLLAANRSGYQAFGIEEDETSLLIEEEDETSLLQENISGRSMSVRVQYPTLCRSATGQTVEINKPVFRLGKERSYVDYFISDNQAISRSHADIISRGDHFFVCDRNSTNHTYINGRILDAEREELIADGDVLRLANEEFVFQIRK